MRSDYYEPPWKRSGPVLPAPGSQPEPPAQGESGRAEMTPCVRRRASGRRRSGFFGFLLFFALILGMTGSIFAVRGLPLLRPSKDWEDRLPGGDIPWDFGGGDSDGGDGDWWTFDQDDWVDLLEETAIRAFPTGGQVTLELQEGSGETLSPAQIYEAVNPSVVGIRTTGTRGIGTGTGIILTSDGYIVTNAHVIAGGHRADVLFPNSMLVSASLVGYDKETDLAVLKINAKDLPAARFGDSDLLRVGEAAYAIGNPLGEELRGTMTDGIISAIDRPVSARNGSMTLIQTTAALNPGNSGGALVNAAGEIIGITNMKMMSEYETIEGLGFAIPSALVKDVAEQLIATGSYAGRPMLGVTVTNHFDENNTPDGALVVSVEHAADAYGKLRADDLIVEAEGQAVTCTDDLLRIKNAMSIGDELHLLVRRSRTHLGDEWTEKEITIVLMSDRALTSAAEPDQTAP